MATNSTVPSPEKSSLTRAQIDVVAAGTLALVAAVAGRVVRVYRLLLNAHGAQLATFRDTTPTVLVPELSLGAGAGLVLDFDGEPWMVTDVGKGLELVLTEAVQTSGVLWYTQREEA